MAFDLNENNVTHYLMSEGLLKYQDVVDVETLGWGISNTVVKVMTTNRNIVVKQSLEYLRVKEEWKADRTRIYRERECIDILKDVLEAGSLPEIIYEDQSNFLFVMSAAPEDSVNWKELLLSGKISPEIAKKSGTLLRRLHNIDIELLGRKEIFANLDSFVELRIDPYHRTVSRLHRDVSDIIDREADRMLETQVALVHGDYSPKNLLVFKNKPFLIDFEVAHYGNPVFDLAFMLNHLLLKAIANAPQKKDFFDAIKQFLIGYNSSPDLPADHAVKNDNHQMPIAWGGKWSDRPIREIDLIKQIGCLMLSRIDGKSPVEYINNQPMKAFVRRLSKRLLVENLEFIAEMINLFDFEMTYDNKLKN